MLELTKLNDEKIYLNPNLIEMVETTPDTLISMMSGNKYYVRESVKEVNKKFSEYYIAIKVNSRRRKRS